MAGPDSAPAPRLTELADQVHAFVQPDGGWCVSNAGVLLGRSSVVVIDTTATRARALRLRAAIAERTSVPPRLVVNTHHHGDHTFGNAVFLPEATVVSHELTRTEALDTGLGMTRLWPEVEWGGVSVEPATLTFTDRIRLHVDDLEVDLLHVGPAHTSNDVVAWVPRHRVLFAGDVLMSGCTPFILFGSLSGSLAALDRLRALDPVTVVCGHGPVGGPELFDQTEAYLRMLRRLARDGLGAGATELEAARDADLGAFAKLLDPERLAANLHRAYAEERGGMPGGSLAVGPALEDMVAFNGGLMPVSHA